jgi:hypothetical protein
MKSKLVFQVFAVCFSLALLGAYVVYAHRQAQPTFPQSTPADPTATSVTGNSEDLASNPTPSQSAENPDRPTLAPSSKLMINVIPRPSFRASPLPAAEEEEVVELPAPSPETVVQRPDGATVTTRVQDSKAPVFAPSSKSIILPVFSTRHGQTIETAPAKPVQINGQILKPGTFRTSKSPRLIGEIPPPSVPKESAPKTPAVTLAQPTTTTAPRETIIFSTKSAPVFVAPRTIVLEAGTPATGTLLPTSPTAGTTGLGSPAPVPPASPAQLIAPDARAPKPDAAPAQQVQRQTEQATKTPTPRPRFLAPGSKSMDLLLVAPQPAAPTAPPSTAPAQAPAPPKPSTP